MKLKVKWNFLAHLEESSREIEFRSVATWIRVSQASVGDGSALELCRLKELDDETWVDGVTLPTISLTFRFLLYFGYLETQRHTYLNLFVLRLDFRSFPQNPLDLPRSARLRMSWKICSFCPAHVHLFTNTAAFKGS